MQLVGRKKNIKNIKPRETKTSKTMTGKVWHRQIGIAIAVLLAVVVIALALTYYVSS